jgi:hypothetical protein
MTNQDFITKLKTHIGNEDSDLRKFIAKTVLANGKDGTNTTEKVLAKIELDAEPQDIKANLKNPSLLMLAKVGNAVFYSIVTTKVAPNVKPNGGKSPKFIADKMLSEIIETLEHEVLGIECAQ